MDFTAKLAELADDRTIKAVEADLEGGYRWERDAEYETAGLVSAEGRTAIVLYYGEDDFEVADWYSERIFS